MTGIHTNMQVLVTKQLFCKNYQNAVYTVSNVRNEERKQKELYATLLSGNTPVHLQVDYQKGREAQKKKKVLSRGITMAGQAGPRLQVGGSRPSLARCSENQISAFWGVN